MLIEANLLDDARRRPRLMQTLLLAVVLLSNLQHPPSFLESQRRIFRRTFLLFFDSFFVVGVGLGFGLFIRTKFKAQLAFG